MKNSPIIKVKNTVGKQLNINANHVVSFCAEDFGTQVLVSTNELYDLDCTERSFRSYMNKAYDVSKNTEEA